MKAAGGAQGSVAEPSFRVELTASFLERMAAIEAFLTEAAAAFAYDRLLDELRTTVIPNLRRFPRIGRRYLDQPPQSAEALALVGCIAGRRGRSPARVPARRLP